MATPSEKLAQSLEVLRKLQKRGVIAVRSADLTRTHRERLLANGFLQSVMKGWYIPCRPDAPTGESTNWYASFWRFCAAYLNERFGDDWCLSPEQSLSLHCGNRAIPPQLLVRSPKARNKVTPLPHGTSVFDIRIELPDKSEIDEIEGLKVYSLASALVACPPAFFRQKATDARTALAIVQDVSTVLERLLNGGRSTVAGRLAGAFRNIGRGRIADDILKAMRAAGYDVREMDPFEGLAPVATDVRECSPYVQRLRLQWQTMRTAVIERFPKPPKRPVDADAYMAHVEEVYVMDAYNSLSIEGYRVSPELIERVRTGAWNPDENAGDRQERNALAARGYWQAHQAVRESVRKVLSRKDPGAVADEDHGTWYRELFAPSVVAGLLRPGDLAGYRTEPVFIRGSMHVPPNRDAVRDLMPAFFELLRGESDPAARIVLGHFTFVYIHPHRDGNGRMGRFLMNVMLAAGGCPWTVIPVEQRDAYMEALEHASVRGDIGPFTDFLAALVRAGSKARGSIRRQAV